MKKLSDKIIKKSIANKAAEIIFEEGVSDYLFAKKKAAKTLNYDDHKILPSNIDIDQALKSYQNLKSLFRINEEEFALLKKVALEFMNIFKDFHPHVSGPLASGKYIQNQKLLINLYSDDTKEIEYKLFDNQLSFEIESTESNPHLIEKYLIYFQDIAINLSVYFEQYLFVNKKESIMSGKGITIEQFKKVELSVDPICNI